ncbi:MAG: RNA 2',3'-cyclic phosphodiesterase [Actinobacteria bacterium]|nr:RNA 2',3'-cyclic phosphodiesterase [Actinomycetota bacterium]
MRLFVAFGVADDVVDRLDRELAPLRDRHPGLNWTPPATWHVTLAFLGEVDGERIDEVEAAVSGAVAAAGQGVGSIELTLAEPGRFGDRVAWLGVEDRPRGAVARLGAAIQDDIAARPGLPVDRKAIRPHVTLARARGRRGRLPPELGEDLPRLDASWTVPVATIFRSHLGAGPLEHEPLVTVPLAG